MKRAIFGIVLAGLAVTALRLMLAFLKADGLAVPAGMETWVFGFTGIASGIVLTGGNAIIAHTLAVRHRTRGLLWWLVALGWLAFLAFAVVLATPAIVLGVRQSTMVGVLSSTELQWSWAIVAVLSIEVLIAISMAAYAMHGEPEQQRRRASGESPFAVLAGAVAKRIEAGTVSNAAEPAEPQQDAGTVRTAERRQSEPAERRQKPEQVACPQAEYGCEFVGTQSGVNAHQRWCEFRPAVVNENGHGH